ncbi:MAG: ATP-binding protein, partial [Hyphomonas sp.]|nr:ATP-binding protein [Hyphomonas sp.]
TVLATEDHEFRTVVVDSITRLEPLIWDDLCRAQKWSSIEDAGYGKGYILTDPYWQDFLQACQYLRDAKGMTVVLIAHETVTTFKDPTTDSYDRYTMRLHKRAEALVRELSDCVLFFNQVTTIRRENKAFGKKDDYTAKGAGSGVRALSCQPRPAFDAKSRYALPDQIIINPGQGYAALAPYLPGHRALNAAAAA